VQDVKCVQASEINGFKIILARFRSRNLDAADQKLQKKRYTEILQGKTITSLAPTVTVHH